MVSGILATLLLLTAVFLIVLVLIQRGKGGGLAGALGGMGGQSAFGTKAGDLFTRITIGVASFWIVLCMIAVKYYGAGTGRLGEDDEPEAPASGPASTDKTANQAGGGGTEKPAGGSSGGPESSGR